MSVLQVGRRSLLTLLSTLLLIQPVGPAWAQVSAGRPPATSGKLTWSGTVEDSAVIVVSGGVVEVESGAEPPVGGRGQFSGPLPARPVKVELKKDQGRGEVRLIQAPNVFNRYVARIAVQDPQPGAGQYRFTLSWKPKSSRDLSKTGRGLNFFSASAERGLGMQFLPELERDLRFIDDPVVTDYIDGLGRRLVERSLARNQEFTFKVVDSKEVNAFAVPGGYIYVNRGLIDLAESEDELAGVLGHEIGHVAGRHTTKRLSKALLVQLLLAVGSAAVGEKSRTAGELVAIAGGVTAALTFLKNGRSDESEADAIGLHNMYDSGYAPAGMISFFEKLREKSGKDPGRFERFLSTHPAPFERIRDLSDEAAFLPDPNRRPRESVEFARVKARLGSRPAPGAPGRGRSRTGRSLAADEVTAPRAWEREALPDRSQVFNREYGIRLAAPAGWSARATMPGEGHLASWLNEEATMRLDVMAVKQQPGLTLASFEKRVAMTMADKFEAVRSATVAYGPLSGVESHYRGRHADNRELTLVMYTFASPEALYAVLVLGDRTDLARMPGEVAQMLSRIELY